MRRLREHEALESAALTSGQREQQRCSDAACTDGTFDEGTDGKRTTDGREPLQCGFGRCHGVAAAGPRKHRGNALQHGAVEQRSMLDQAQDRERRGGERPILRVDLVTGGHLRWRQQRGRPCPAFDERVIYVAVDEFCQVRPSDPR